MIMHRNLSYCIDARSRGGSDHRQVSLVASLAQLTTVASVDVSLRRLSTVSSTFSSYFGHDSFSLGNTAASVSRHLNPFQTSTSCFDDASERLNSGSHVCARGEAIGPKTFSVK